MNQRLQRAAPLAAMASLVLIAGAFYADRGTPAGGRQPLPLALAGAAGLLAAAGWLWRPSLGRLGGRPPWAMAAGAAVVVSAGALLAGGLAGLPQEIDGSLAAAARAGACAAVVLAGGGGLAAALRARRPAGVLAAAAGTRLLLAACRPALIPGLEDWPFALAAFGDGALARNAGDLALTGLAWLVVMAGLRRLAPSVPAAPSLGIRGLAASGGLALGSLPALLVPRLAEFLAASSGREWWSPWSAAQAAGDLLTAVAALTLCVAILAFAWPAAWLIQLAVGRPIGLRARAGWAIAAAGAAAGVAAGIAAPTAGPAGRGALWPLAGGSLLLAACLLVPPARRRPPPGAAWTVLMAVLAAAVLVYPLRHAAYRRQQTEIAALASALAGSELDGARQDLISAARRLGEPGLSDCLAAAASDLELASCLAALEPLFSPPVGVELFDERGRLVARWMPGLPPPERPVVPVPAEVMPGPERESGPPPPADGAQLTLLAVRDGSEVRPLAAMLHRLPDGRLLRLSQGLLERVAADTWPEDLAVRLVGPGGSFQAGRRHQELAGAEAPPDYRLLVRSSGPPGSLVASVTAARRWPTRAERIVDLVVFSLAAWPASLLLALLGAERRFGRQRPLRRLGSLTLPAAVGGLLVVSALAPLAGLAHELAAARRLRSEEMFELRARGAAAMAAEALQSLAPAGGGAGPELRQVLDQADRTFGVIIAADTPAGTIVTRPPPLDRDERSLRSLVGLPGGSEIVLHFFPATGEPAPRRPQPGPLLALAIGVAVLVQGLALTRRVLLPVSALTEAVSRIADGRRPLTPTGIRARGEVGRMTRAVDAMIRHLAAAQRRLRRRGWLVRRVLDRVDAGVVVLDPAGRVRLAGAATGRMLGEPLPTGRPLSGLLAERGLTALAAALERVLAGGPETATAVETHVEESVQGLPRDYRLSAAPLGPADRRGSGWVVVIDDLSRVLTGVRLRTLELVTRDYAHEVGNRIGVIRIHLDRLARASTAGTEMPESAARRERHLQIILRNLEALGAQREALRERLRFLRDPAAAMQPAELRALVIEAVRDEGLDEQPEIRLALDLGPSQLPVLVHPPSLVGAVRNVLRNARQALPAGGGAVVVDAGSEGGQAWVRVADNGPGIPPELLASIFQDAVTTKSQGTGFGLHAAALFVGLHGGRIQASNAPGGGAVFTIRLPLIGAEERHDD